MLVALSVACVWLTASPVVRSLWPRRREVRPIQIVSLVLGIAALALSLGDPAGRMPAIACLVTAGAYTGLGAVRRAWSRRQIGGPWFRRGPSISTSYVYVWFDAAGVGLTTAAFSHGFGVVLPGLIEAGILAGLGTGVPASVKLRRHNHHVRVSSAGPLRLPDCSGLPHYPVRRP